MSDRCKSSAPPPTTTLKNKRAPVSIASSSSSRSGHAAVAKNKNDSWEKVNEDMRTIHECGGAGSAGGHRDAYTRFFRDVLAECLVKEKCEREETQVEVEMAQLAERLNKTAEQLDRTNKRLDCISFAVETNRLHDLKSQDFTHFYEISKRPEDKTILNNQIGERNVANDIDTVSADCGRSKASDHSGLTQLLEAVTDALEGLEEIKRTSNINDHFYKFKDCGKTHNNLYKGEKEKNDLEYLNSDLEGRFSNLREDLLKEASEKIAIMMESDDEDDE